jgi:low temperature requirement protein LtrA
LHWLPGRGQRVGLGQTDIAGEHLIERFRLFFLIVLGESVLTAGNAFTDEPFEVERLLALAIGFTGTVALWWCYLSRSRPPPRGPYAARPVTRRRPRRMSPRPR